MITTHNNVGPQSNFFFKKNTRAAVIQLVTAPKHPNMKTRIFMSCAKKRIIKGLPKYSQK